MLLTVDCSRPLHPMSNLTCSNVLRWLLASLQADYIVLWALPAAAAIAGPGAPEGPKHPEGISGLAPGLSVSAAAAADAAAAEAALLPGVFALYGACSPAEVRCRHAVCHRSFLAERLLVSRVVHVSAGLKLTVSHEPFFMQIQHLFVTLGGRASGRGRAVLSDLRRGYETDFKYEGKV